MAGVPDGKLVRLQWPGGVNNVQPETAVPADHLRGASNVDLDDAGRPRTRLGYQLRVSGAAHSLHATDWHLFSVVDGALIAHDRNMAATVVRSSVGERPVSYAQFQGKTVWSDGNLIRSVDDDLVDAPFGVECNAQPSASVYPAGGLHAGCYQVAITFRTTDGEESGSSLAAVVDVPEGSGIMVVNIPTHDHASFVRLYVSNANGDDLYHAADIPVGVSSYLIGAGNRGKALETQFMEPMPAGQIIRAIAGRLFVASADTLTWSEPYRALRMPDNYIRYPGGVTLLEACGEGPELGVYVSARHRDNQSKQAVYFLRGPDPKAWVNVKAYPYGVVPGTAVQVPASVLGLEYSGLVPYWLSTNGMFCVGLPGGRVLPLTENKFVADNNAARGATLFREREGIRQMLTTAQGGTAAVFGATDEAVATVYKHGITT